ncbi:AAA family ATPase [Cohnella soli]|uniref:AAA family ATPase n=1 Tax=Cohnella soli TaxID=425005 RepID=A0ABW0HUK1_9BACL
MNATTSADNVITLRTMMTQRGGMNPENFIPLARSLAASVEHAHRQSSALLDLRPEGIGVRSDGQELFLVRDAATASSPELSLPYCAPENTGRMQRQADKRSDLYSLGVVFYEMLSGRLPFQAETPLEWVYAHLAQNPLPLADGTARLPDGMASIVMKLLEKNPDNRYQNAGSLIADLDKIGRTRDTFVPEPVFHGRETEMETLTQIFYSVRFGATEMAYVSGEAGIGKTSLVEALFRDGRHAGSCYYISGKFEQLSKDSPYLPIIQAFRGLLRHLLGERAERTAQVRTKLREALGANADVIASIIPEAGMLLGDLPPAQELPANESQKRFTYVFRKFVQALASKDRPLVLFIDDLHWANPSTIQLIDALLRDPECQYLMIICAYRASEMNNSILPGYEGDGSVTDQAIVRHLHLLPLDSEPLHRIAMATLGTDADTAWSLTESLRHQAGGNPFHYKQILLRLRDDRVLDYDPDKRGWQWNFGQWLKLDENYAVQELIERRLTRLSDNARELLEAASSVGSVFSPLLIEKVSKAERAEAAWAAMEAEGLIVPDETNQYRFAHDHIQKMIYGRIEPENRISLHHRIGLRMEEAADGREYSVYDIVSHLNQGAARITDERYSLRLVHMNLEAGNQAKAASAADIALGFFAKGLELLGEERGQREFSLRFELLANKAECEYLCGNIAQSLKEISTLLSLARNPLERGRVQLIRIMQHINQGKYLEGTALGLESLKELRVHIEPNPGNVTLFLEGIRAERLLRSRYDRLEHLPPMSDEERIAAMNLIFAIVPSTFFTDKNVFFLLVCRAIQLSLKHGNSQVSAAFYTSYGMLLGLAMGKFEKGYALGKVGLEMSERDHVNAVVSKTHTMFGGVLCQFAGDARDGDVYLQKALRSGLEAGDYVFASYAMGAHVNSLYTRAKLSELERTIADYMSVLETTNDEFVKLNFFLYLQVIAALRGRTKTQESFSGEGFDEEAFLTHVRNEETSDTTLFQFCTYKTQLHYLLGNDEEAARWAHQASDYETYSTHLPHWPECSFYESLALAAIAARGKGGPHERKRLSRNLRRYRRWAAWSPANFQARLCLIEAELALSKGEQGVAEEKYDKAIREAREHDDTRTLALANELAAKHYLACGQRNTAAHYLQSAIVAYASWEIPIKVKRLKAQLRQSTEQDGGMSENAPSNDKASGMDSEPVHGNAPISSDSMDLAEILRSMRAMTNRMNMDTVLAEIMGTMMKYAGASKGAILTGNGEVLHVQAYADTENRGAVPAAGSTDGVLLPEGLIRYVFRTGEEILYSGEEDSWLIHNPYVAANRPQSALCIPVAVHGTMLGVLYLENKSARGIFSSERVAVLLELASQGLLLRVLQNASEPSPASSDSAYLEEAATALAEMDEPLTDRELEVLALLAAGLSNKEIADRLIIAIGTVKVHVKNIFAKLKVNRRTKAIAQAKELQLIE